MQTHSFKQIIILLLFLLFGFNSVYSQKTGYWNLNGNNILSGEFLGTTNSMPLIIKTANVNRMTILSTTNTRVGIDILNPVANFHLNSIEGEDNQTKYVYSYNKFLMTNVATGTTKFDGFMIEQTNNEVTVRQQEQADLLITGPSGGFTIKSNGHIMFGSGAFTRGKINVFNDNIILMRQANSNSLSNPTGAILFGGGDGASVNPVWSVSYFQDTLRSGLNFWKPYNNPTNYQSINSVLFLSNNGNVGIGVDNPLAKLSVDGLICAKEIRVSLSGAPCWPDYVFDANYSLISLNELEKFISINKHLPNIPSATEVEKNGVNLGEMNRVLLQKIEEMTLYIIQMEKRITELENKK